MAVMQLTPARGFSWRDAPDLMARLTTAQNHPRFTHQDILTFAGFMDSRETLEAYVVGKETLVADDRPEKRRRASAKQLAA